MKRILILLLAVVFVQFWSCQQAGFEYPVTEKVDQVDTYFNTEVPDPYRWLEDDNSEETAEWVKAENAVTHAYLEKIPFRQGIIDRLTEISD